MKKVWILVAMVLCSFPSLASEYESLSLGIDSDIEGRPVVNHIHMRQPEPYLHLSETLAINTVLYGGAAVSGFGTLGLIGNAIDYFSPGSMTIMSLHAAVVTVEFGIGILASGCGLKTLNRWGYGLYKLYSYCTRQVPSAITLP